MLEPLSDYEISYDYVCIDDSNIGTTLAAFCSEAFQATSDSIELVDGSALNSLTIEEREFDVDGVMTPHQVIEL